MKKLFTTYLYCLTACLLHASAFACEVKKITINGNQRIDRETIISYAEVQIGDLVNESRLHNLIQLLYATEYFGKISARCEDDELSINILENPMINNIYIDGDSLFSYDQIKKDLLTQTRTTYTKSKIKSDADKMKMIHQRYGMLNASVEAKVVPLNDNRVDVVFEINQGEPLRISNINIYGNDNVKESTILDIIPLKKPHWLNPLSKGSNYEVDKVDASKDIIKDYYKENGYIDFEILDSNEEISRDANLVALNFYIHEGKRYKVGEIKIENLINILTLNINKTDYKQTNGTIYNAKKSKIDIQMILKKSYDIGFGYVNVEEVLEKDNINGIVNIIYKITDDNVKQIRRIKINGNEKTRDYIIRRELLFSEKSTLMNKDLERSKYRLYSLGYFKEVDIHEVETEEKNVVDINVTIKEEDRRANINFSAGYSDFIGTVIGGGFQFFNVAGKGYDLSADLSTSQITRNIGFGLNTARFGDSKFGGGIDVGFSSFDPSRYGILYKSKSFYIAPRISYRLGDSLYHIITYSYRKDDMQNTPNPNSFFLRTLFNNQFQNVTTSSITNTLSYNTLDNFVLPYQGNVASISQTIAGLGGTQSFVKHDIELTAWRQIFGKKSPSMVSLKAGTINSMGSDVLFINRYAVWYFNMRGFGFGGLGPRLIETRPDGSYYIDAISYRGNQYAIGTIEQHFPIPLMQDTTARWYLFSDFAMLTGVDGMRYYKNANGNSEQIVDSHMIRNASGIGIAMPSPLGVIKLDYSAYIKHAYYDSVQQFRISIGNMPIN